MESYLLEKGKIGEEMTAYQLRFLRDEYRVFNGIYITGGNETQEFDHIVIGPNGIFHIESKNYSGFINFTEQGVVLNNGNFVDDDPRSQMHRHDYVIKQIVKENYRDVDVSGILCLTDQNCSFVGSNPFFDIVKIGMLTNTIKLYPPKIVLERKQIEDLAQIIETNSTHSQTYESKIDSKTLLKVINERNSSGKNTNIMDKPEKIEVNGPEHYSYQKKDYSMPAFYTSCIMSGIAYLFIYNGTGLEKYLLCYLAGLFGNFAYIGIQKEEKTWSVEEVFTGFLCSGVAQWVPVLISFFL